MTNQKMKLKNSIYNNIKKYKRLGIHLTKEGQDLHIGNYKALLKEIKDLSKYPHIHGPEGLISLRWQYSPN